MSAFMVSKSHIDVLVTFARSRRDRLSFMLRDEYDADKIGSILWEQNRKSVNHRYPGREEPEVEYRHRKHGANLPMVTIIKAIKCLRYQSCETDDWKSTDACTILDVLEGEAIALLPGYNEAPWGIDDY